MSEPSVDALRNIRLTTATTQKLTTSVINLLDGSAKSRYRAPDNRIITVLQKSVSEDRNEGTFTNITLEASQSERSRDRTDELFPFQMLTILEKNGVSHGEVSQGVRVENPDRNTSHDYKANPANELDGQNFLTALSSIGPEVKIDEFDRIPAEQKRDKEVAATVRGETERVLRYAREEGTLAREEDPETGSIIEWATFHKNGKEYTIYCDKASGQILVDLSYEESDIISPDDDNHGKIIHSSLTYALGPDDIDNRLMINATTMEIESPTGYTTQEDDKTPANKEQRQLLIGGLASLP